MINQWNIWKIIKSIHAEENIFSNDFDKRHTVFTTVRGIHKNRNYDSEKEIFF